MTIATDATIASQLQNLGQLPTSLLNEIAPDMKFDADGTPKMPAIPGMPNDAAGCAIM